MKFTENRVMSERTHVDTNFRRSNSLKLLQPHTAILGHTEDLSTLGSKQRRSALLKSLGLTIAFILICIASLIPMFLFSLWPLVTIPIVTLLLYLFLLHYILGTYRHQQTALTHLRHFHEERRSSIPPPPAVPPPVITNYHFPDPDGKRGSLINWVMIDSSPLDCPLPRINPSTSQIHLPPSP